MIRELILTLVLIGVSQGDLQWFYGKWSPVMILPKTIILPECKEYIIFESLKQVQCACDDGRNTTYLAMDLLKNTTEYRETYHLTELPAIEADDTTDIMSLLRVSCTCGEKTFTQRVVVKPINKNYAILYTYEDYYQHFYTEAVPNTAHILTKNIESAQTIENVVKHFRELKSREGLIFCSKEILTFGI